MDIQTFVKEAREKGLNDDKIRQLLISNNWDESEVEMALSGLSVPKPKAAAPQASNPKLASPEPTQPTEHASLSPLLAALHHIILWFFTASSAVTIGGTIASLYGADLSTSALASMIAVTLITFIPYAFLFILFLQKTRHNPELVPGKVWSIITVCLHSVGAMIAAIVAVVALITGGDTIVLISAGLVFMLDILVVITYCLATFVTGKKGLRRGFLIAYLPLLLIMFGVLFTMSSLKLGPAKHDEEVRKNLTTTVQNVHTYTSNKKHLPADDKAFELAPGTTYTKTSDSTYKVCGVFQSDITPAKRGNIHHSATSIDDSYVYDSAFAPKGAGTQCYDIESYELSRQSVDPNFFNE